MDRVSAFRFRLNGEEVEASGASSNTTLLTWLRAHGRTGTKEGCAEGDCGACSVLLLDERADGAPTYRAINSCLALMPMVAGREVWTAEGLARGGRGGRDPLHLPMHPVQAKMVEHYGSQCGYCTPGFVCSMAEAYYRDEPLDDAALGDQLSGNLCRCTGYRPIREAMVDALAAKDTTHDAIHARLDPKHTGVRALDYEAEGERFVRPTTLDALLAIRAERPDAVLVAGATEIGVEINKKAKSFPFLVSTEGVRELAKVERTSAGFRVHGAATLTALEEAAGGAIPALRKMLWVFASRQIRSRATLAGNLVTASPIGDMAPVLLALDATITLTSRARGDRTLPLADFFLGYRKTALAPDEIVRFVDVPLPRPGARFDTFKVSKRRELDISIVAAGLAVGVGTDGRIDHARLAFGGVAATPVRARETEALLVGRAFDDETLRLAKARLAAELEPISDVRAGAGYRSGLAPALLEKLWRGETSLAQDATPGFSRSGAPPPRSASRDLKHESAVGHVTGAARYVDDAGVEREGALVLWPVMAKEAHARLVSIDTREAEKMPGVVCVLTAKDIPGTNDVGAIRHDESLLADREILFHGHMVAVVVGASYLACRRAAEAVKVELEPLDAILGVRAAIAARSFHTEPHVIARGEPDRALGEAPLKLSGELDIGGQEHFYLETHAAWAERGDEGDVFVTSSTQHPSEVQAVVSHVLNLPRNKVVVQSPRMGGGFGGKETQGNTWAALVALAAMKTGRRVRVQLDRDLDMMLTGKRHPFFARYEVGFDREGKILAMKADLVSDGGWALDLSESICDRALFHVDNAYAIPNIRVTGRVARTHVTSHTAFRGFGGPQGMVVIEEIMDGIARTLGLAPEVVREKNLYREGDFTHYEQRLDDVRIGTIWARLAKSAEVAARRAEVARHNEKPSRIKRGLAVTPVKFGISFTASFLNQAGALVLVYRDGTVQVNHGGTEMGQGLYTKMLGVAMRELGLPAEAIRVMKTQTDKVPNTSATAASSGADLNGAAVRNACVVLRERLAPVAADLLSRGGRALPLPAESVQFEDGHVFAPDAPDAKIPFAKVVEEAYLRQIPLSANGFYRTPNLAYDKAKGRGRPFYYFAYGAAVAEVEVDGYSGMKRVLRVDIVHDVGESLNPGVDRGQVEGAFVQGMGWLTGEELVWDAKGRLASHSASTYQIPSIGDAPLDFRVELLPNAPQSGTIHGSKAVGEPPLMLGMAVREAIRDAVAAFGAARGPVALACPATHEAIFHAILRREGGGDRAREAAE